MAGLLGGEKMKKVARFVFETTFGPFVAWCCVLAVFFAAVVMSYLGEQLDWLGRTPVSSGNLAFSSRLSGAFSVCLDCGCINDGGSCCSGVCDFKWFCGSSKYKREEMNMRMGLCGLLRK